MRALAKKGKASVLASLLAICGALALAGCAGYRAGPVNGVTAGARAVTVRPFRNDTFEPRLTEAVDFALRRKLQQDGTYRLDTHGEGDIVVTGVIIDMNRAPLSFQPTDVLTPRDYEMRLVAKVTATERITGKMVLDREFVGRTTVRASNNRDLAERQAQPTIAEDLARNITSALTEGPW
jgi:hypothetical protein